MQDRSVRYRASQTRRGFTLVELMIVIIITITLAAIAMPRYARSVEIHRANSAAQRVMRDLNLAHENAISTSSSRTVAFDTVSDTYGIDVENALDHTRQSYKVRISDGPYLADLTKVNFGGDATVIFDGFGQPDSGGTVVLEAGRQRVTITLDGNTGVATTTSSGGK